VKLGRSAGNVTEVSAYPNPFQSQLSVSITATESEVMAIQLYSIDGRLVSTQQEQLNAGSNVVTVNNLDNLAKGMYVLNIQSGDEIKTVRLVK